MRRSLTLLVTFALFCTLFVATAGAQSQVTLTVSVEDGDGDPVAGATINATWDDGETTARTASNGRAFVDVPEGADVSLDIEHDEYVRNQPLVVEDASERDVTVEVARKGHSTVTVVDGDDRPLDGASVQFRRGTTTVTSGETDADGTYRSGVVEQGEYRLVVVKPEYFRESRNVEVGSDTDEAVELQRGSVRLEVDIVDDHFEEPRTLEDARVSIEATNTEFDANVRARGGTASLSVPVNTRYDVTVSKDDYLDATRTVSVTEADRSIQIATQRTPTLTVEPQNSRVVIDETTRLRVVNAYDEPVANATVTRDGETVGETDANGEVTVRIDVVGSNEFVATHDGVESEIATVEGIDPDADDESLAETPSPTPDDATGDGVGFGFAVAAVALAIAAFVVRRRS